MRQAIIAFIVLVLFLTPALVETPTVDAGAGTLQPGDRMTSSVGGCTLNFVYDGIGAQAGEVYMGTAHHCVGAIGSSVAAEGYSSIGTVAFKGDRTDGSRPEDFAFIRIQPQFHSEVFAGVRGHEQWPTGHTTASEAGLGDIVWMSGYGMVFSTFPVTRENRAGVLYTANDEIYSLYGPLIFGDSGGPLVHESGKALGIVSGINGGCCSEGIGAYDIGPTVEGILEKAASRGFTAQLRTV